MNARTIVIYNSKRGATRQYAEWIAEDLDCRCVALQNCDLHSLEQFELILFGGWLRGSGIVGLDKIKKKVRGIEDRLIVFACGISEYNPANYMQICEINFKGATDMSNVGLYYCPGAYDPARVQGLDRMLMGIAKKILMSGRTGGEASEAAEAMRDAIVHGIDRMDRRYADQIVRAARQKLSGEDSRP